MNSLNDSGRVHEQYGTADNLNIRVRLHQLFSTNKLGWMNWVFQNLDLREGQAILELGCGNGGLWKDKQNKLPCGTKLVLTDFSEGMLNSAKANTAAISCVEYLTEDAQQLSFEDDSFDVVIANHMLYHVPNIDKALNEITRVVKPGGLFYASTAGENNLSEMYDMLAEFDRETSLGRETVPNTFCLENGAEKLGKFFKSIEIREYHDSLHITDPEPLFEYISSLKGFIDDMADEEYYGRLKKYIFDIFNKKGCIAISKSAGIFVSAKPIKRKG